MPMLQSKMKEILDIFSDPIFDDKPKHRILLPFQNTPGLCLINISEEVGEGLCLIAEGMNQIENELESSSVMAIQLGKDGKWEWVVSEKGGGDVKTIGEAPIHFRGVSISALKDIEGSAILISNKEFDRLEKQAEELSTVSFIMVGSREVTFGIYLAREQASMTSIEIKEFMETIREGKKV